jgi:hypothetical protein
MIVSQWRPPRDRKFSAASRRAIEIVMVMTHNQLCTTGNQCFAVAFCSCSTPKKYLPAQQISPHIVVAMQRKFTFVHNEIGKP